MKILEGEQGTKQWLRNRLGKLTASHAQTIQANGRGLETYVYKKVSEIITGKRPDSYSNKDMERGNEMEDHARTSYEMETGNKVEQVGFCQLNERVGASPDGLVGEDGLVEFKCPRDYNYVRASYTEKIKKKYVWQMQMQMYVTDRKWCDYVVFHENFSDDLIISRVDRDEEMIEKLEKGIESGKKQIEAVLKKINSNKK